MSKPGSIIISVFCVLACLRGQSREASLERHYEVGERALAEGRYADAERAYLALRELAPATAEVHAKLGLVYFQQGKYEQALPILRQALKLKPGMPKAGVFIAMCLSELGRYREAVPALEKAFRTSVDPALKRMTGLHLERSYTALEQHAKAVEVALMLSRLYPDDPEVLYHTSRLFGNYAFLSVRKLADVAPASLWAHLAAGEIHESAMSYEQAIFEYRKVLAADPGRPGIHLRIGRVLLAQGKDEARAAAAAEFDQELKLDPTNANAAYELGEILRKDGQDDQARAMFERALKYDPEFQEARVGLARVLLIAEKPDAALPHLKKALNLKPGDAVVYYHLGRAYRALGNAAEAQKWLSESRRLRAAEVERAASTFRPPPAQSATQQQLDPDAP